MATWRSHEELYPSKPFSEIGLFLNDVTSGEIPVQDVTQARATFFSSLNGRSLGGSRDRVREDFDLIDA